MILTILSLFITIIYHLIPFVYFSSSHFSPSCSRPWLSRPLPVSEPRSPEAAALARRSPADDAAGLGRADRSWVQWQQTSLLVGGYNIYNITYVFTNLSIYLYIYILWIHVIDMCIWYQLQEGNSHPFWRQVRAWVHLTAQHPGQMAYPSVHGWKIQLFFMRFYH